MRDSICKTGGRRVWNAGSGSPGGCGEAQGTVKKAPRGFQHRPQRQT